MNDDLPDLDDDLTPADPTALAESLRAMPTWEVDVVDLVEAEVEVESAPDPKPVEEVSADEPDSDTPPPLVRVLEAMLFVNDGPLSEARACGTVRGLVPEEFHALIDELARAYKSQGRPYFVRRKEEGYVLDLRARFSGVREKMSGAAREARLTTPAVEVLALIAYRQPIARPEIDSLRGADSAGLLRQLVRHGLIAVQRTQEVSYVTTSKFLDLFQLSSIEDLPRTQELRQL